MTNKDRDFLRGIAQRSVAHQRFAEIAATVPVLVCVVEWKPVVSGCGVCLRLVSDGTSATAGRFDATQVPLWQGEVPCDPRFVRAVVRRLVRLGLWELNDFTPARQLLDGEYYIIRAVDPDTPWEADACLFCPSEAASRGMRKLGAFLYRLVRLTPAQIARNVVPSAFSFFR